MLRFFKNAVEDWMMVETEEQSLAELSEHRKVRLNSIFDVENATWHTS